MGMSKDEKNFNVAKQKEIKNGRLVGGGMRIMQMHMQAFIQAHVNALCPPVPANPIVK